MANGLLVSPGPNTHPSAAQVAVSTNYITDFNFLNTYLPDTYDREFARYGNRSISSFLRVTSSEFASASDKIIWAEEGHLHIKYSNCTSASAASSSTATFTVADAGVTSIALRKSQTIMIQNNSTGVFNKGIITSIPSATTFTVAYYEPTGQAFAVSTQCSLFIYGSEFRKGTEGMEGSLEAEDEIFSNNPIIIKDKYVVNGSDMAQIGWIKVDGQMGEGYLWYIKSEHETRLRFEDYLETAMLESVPAAANSGAAAAGYVGSEGIFYVVNNRGNVWGGGTPSSLADWDSIVSRLDKQGAIEENAIFANRALSFDIDNMLAETNGAYSGGTSYGLFENGIDMALQLGFTSFRRGYDFHKSDWKYLNDPTMRGGLSNAASTATGTITGLMIPAGSTSVYDQVVGSKVDRPYIHIRYRASEATNRKYQTWITGGAGDTKTNNLDAMEVNFLSERCACVLGACNAVLFRNG